MLISRKIKAHEQERFMAFNQTNGGTEVASTYLATAQARVFVRPQTPNHWLAGYVVNTQPPFRCLSVLNDQQRSELLSAKNLHEHEFAEITLLCRDRSIRWTPLERCQYYFMSIWDAFGTGCPYLLGGTTNPQLLGEQLKVLDQILYEGDMNFFGQKKQGWLFYVSRNRVLFNLSRYMAGQLWKAIRPQPAPAPAQPSAGV